jgi:hypothetical protein
MSWSPSLPPRPARLILCADDYGISPAVSAGIRQLIALGRLSATGVMATMPAWRREAPALKELEGQVAVGLHVTFTDQPALGPVRGLAPDGRFPGLARLFRCCFSGLLDHQAVRAELERQLDAFEAAFGRSPDFIDGHQHVHLLPGIRQAVLALFDRRLDRQRCWLRDCWDRPGALAARGQAAKAGFVALLGLPMHVAARQRGLRCNRGFSGFYDGTRMPFAEGLGRMLRRAGDGHLLMVHPGHVDAELTACDSLTTPREGEWRTLSAPDFPERLAGLGFTVAGPAFPG